MTDRFFQLVSGRGTDVEPVPDPQATAAEVQRLRTTYLRLVGAARGLVAGAKAVEGAARDEFKQVDGEAARQRRREQTSADAELSEAHDTARATLLGSASRLAPGPASASWDAAGWRSSDWLGSASARHLRLGSLEVSGLPRDEDLPALVPLLDVGNVAVVADGGASWATEILTGLVLRAVAAVPAGRLEVVVFDPRIRGVFSPFAGLRRASTSIFGEPLVTTNQLVNELHHLRSAVARVAELVGSRSVADLGSLVAATEMQPEPYRLLVVLDYPTGVDSAVQGELLRIADGGPKRGVSMLIHHDPQVRGATSVDPADLLTQATIITGRAGAVTVGTFPGVTVHPDGAPPRQLIGDVADLVADRADRAAAPSVDFADLLPPVEETWAHQATEGMTATLGMSGFDRVTMNLRGADPALPNVLVGGASGQGKSNLLLVLLHSIAASYSPDEVEMYLLDFKDGLEFDRLGPRPDRPHWMPHVRVLGLEGDRLFGLAVLRHLDAEFGRRAEKFRTAGHNHLAAYRQAHPDERVPRVLVVIDEFQVLIGSQDDIGHEAVRIIETLARRGRAVGMHLVLASQTLSGIEGLATKEQSIFGQFPWRVSLKTEASESEAILGRGNHDAAQLRFRGEAILNSEYGARAHNRRGIIAYADESLLDKLRSVWWAKAKDPVPPRVFYASRPTNPAELPGALSRVLSQASDHDDGARHALLGLPVDVDPHPIAFTCRPDPGRTLAIVGDGRDEALGALTAAVWSLAAQELRAEFVLLDALAGSGLPTPEVQTMAEAARAKGHDVTVHAGRDIAQALIDIGERLTERLAADTEQAPVYVVAPGMHRATRLDQYMPNGDMPGDALRRLVGEGPVAQMYLLGWWSTLNVFQRQLEYAMSGLVGSYLFLRLPQGDVQSVCGPYIRYEPRPHRGLYWDRAQGSDARPIVPFGLPSREQLLRLGEPE